MAVNRYTEFNPQPYVSTYVPLPLEMMYQGLANKQKQFDKTMDETYKLQDLMAKVNAIDKHKKYKKELENKYYPKIDEIANEITKTGDLTKARDIKKLARDWEHDELRQELETSYANYQAYQKDKIAKGDKYGEWYDNYLPFQGSDEAGNIAGYRYTGMGEIQDHQKRASEMMDKVAADALKSAGFKMNPDGTIIKGGSGWEKVAAEKIQQLAQMKSLDFLSTAEGKDYAKMLKYYNPNMTDNDLINQATKYLYDAGANQIFNKSESESDIAFSPWAKDLWDIEQEKNQLNPMQELPVKNPGDITNKDALNVFGLGENVNNDGTFQDSAYKGATKYEGVIGAPSYAQTYNTKTSTTKDNKKLVDFYTGLNNTAKRLGIQIPKTNGKTDYKALQELITKIGKNYLTSGQVGQGLQAELSNNMSAYYLGTYDSNGEFSKSPFLETSKIVEIGNDKQITTDDEKSIIAKNGVIKDINFYAEEPGTFVVTSNDGANTKDYNMYLGEKHSKELTRPMWELTKSFDRSIKGDIKEDEYTAILKSQDNHKKELSELYTNIQNPQLKQVLENNLNMYLTETPNTKTTSIKYSAEKTISGISKYTFIGKQIFNPSTGEPINKVVVINNETGSITLDDLNNTQAKEAAYIQSVIKTGYKPKLRKDEQ